MRPYFIGYLLPALLVILAVPMALGMVPPNRWYGFRTPKTLSSPDIWYAANRASAWFLIAAGLLAIGLNLALSRTHPDWPPSRLTSGMAGVTVISVLLAVVASLLWLRLRRP